MKKGLINSTNSWLKQLKNYLLISEYVIFIVSSAQIPYFKEIS